MRLCIKWTRGKAVMTHQIEVEDDACVLMMDSQGDFKMLIPTPEDPQGMVPMPIVFMTALGLMVAKDDELFKFVMERFDKILENYLAQTVTSKDVDAVLEFFARNVEQLRSKKDG